MTPTTIENWITAHGIPMVVTLLVIFLIFKYFLKQIESPNKKDNTSIEFLTNKIITLSTQIEKNTTTVSTCQQTLVSLKSFLSGVYFRNRGMDDE